MIAGAQRAQLVKGLAKASARLFLGAVAPQQLGEPFAPYRAVRQQQVGNERSRLLSKVRDFATARTD
jgi:hypothetical protein